ncbi:arylamine N-acetyltransferase family protein [Sulfurisoma sediminicola]|nr:arylamine N-acetyltransferase [Sulfurisoma sediminicola]
MEPTLTDLSAYLRRTGYAGDIAPTRRALEALHLAHATHIPFENLDVLLGRPIALDLVGIEAKLVGARRGGYCFEHNLLFAAVLRAFGFAVTRLAARVRHRTTAVLPRTHMLLLVEAEGGRWLADVGFGGEGLLLPVPFGAGEEVGHFAWSYRVIEEAATANWVLQSRRDGAWRDLYAFTLEPQHTVDYAIANHYVSTHPDSPFVRMLTVQLPTPQRRLILRDRELIEDRGDVVTTRTLADGAELARVLQESFGLEMPPGIRLPG